MCIEGILQNYYGVKKVVRKKDKIAFSYETTSGEGYLICDSLTLSGKKAFVKLVGLLRDMENIFGGSYKADPWVVKLKEIASKRWNIYDNADIEARMEAQIEASAGGNKNLAAPKRYNTSLDCIMQSQFGIKKVFLKTPKVVGYFLGGDPDPSYDYFTKAGGKAYNQLTKLIYDLGVLFGSDFDSNHIVNCFDEIASENRYKFTTNEKWRHINGTNENKSKALS